MTIIDKIKKECMERIQDMDKEEAKKFINKWLFELEMSDTWNYEIAIKVDVLNNILEELQKGE